MQRAGLHHCAYSGSNSHQLFIQVGQVGQMHTVLWQWNPAALANRKTIACRRQGVPEA